MKSFKAEVLKAVTEATQQSFVASELKLMTEVIGNVVAGRRGSSPSANDADPAARREADKQGQKRAGGGEDATSVKRSKVGPGGSRTGGQSVVDQLKKNGAKVIRSHSKGDGIGSADGGPADEVAAQDDGPTASPLVADKEIPPAQTAKDGGARTVKGPSVEVAGTTSIPRKPPAASSAPVGPSAANNDGPALAATPAPAGPSAAKGDAKDATKEPAAANALREMLHRMEAHRRDVQQPPLVDAAPAETARPSVTPHVAASASIAPPTAPLLADRPPADPKSALLRARLGARSAAAPTRTQPEAGSSATPTSVNVAAPTPGAAVVDAAAEKGVRAALATGGAVAPAQAAKGQNDAEITAIHDLSGDAHHDALLPAIWFPVVADTKEGQEKADAMMSAMIARVSMCAAYGKNDDAEVVDAVGKGKAAAMVVGASEMTADVFLKVMQAVLDVKIDREQPLGEVAHNVAPALQSSALQRAYPGVEVKVEAAVMARAMVETMAFWGMCPVAGPKLEETGIAVPCDAQMEHDFKERGRKGQRGKQGKSSTGKKGKKGRKGKDSTAA
ncbi:unnamed protein product [Closterium sp. Naga37s-1]|nr:unnamed protein product [Closterium sp. Naga37s-1]